MGGCGPHGGVPGIVGWAEGVSPVSGFQDQAAPESIGVDGLQGVEAVKGAVTPGQAACEPAAKASCEHFYASHCYGGMSIRLCMLCHEPDWDDHRQQLEAAAQAAIDAHLARHPTP